LAGANGITVHLRKDRRHINDRDVRVLKETVASKFNLEMGMDPEMVRIAEQLRPDQVTLVPENRAELTTEGGLDCAGQLKRLTDIVKRMHKKGILVSAFIVPDEKQILASAEVGCDAVELHTGQYANAATDAQIEYRLNELRDARDTALAAGLVVHAGHGLTYRNIQPVARIENLCEFNIGHSIVARAVLVGMQQAVKEMNNLIHRPF
jgi:pyridoxine 5-phosphate synthase